MKRWAVGFAVVVVLVGQANAMASIGDVLQVFSDPAPSAYHGFGWSVAAVGDKVLVGAPNHITGVAGTGDAYLFDSSGTLVCALENPPGRTNDGFGFSVAAVGSDFVVGALADDYGATNSGAAYLFETSGTHLKTFLNPTPAEGDSFGVAVASNGTHVLVGANGDDGTSVDAGAVHLFDSATGALLHTIPNPNSLGDYELFGCAVASVGDRWLVGAKGKFPGPGVAYLIDSDGNQVFRLPGPDGSEYFGSSVAALGTDLLVGAPGHFHGDSPTPGTVYLFSGVTGELLQAYHSPTPDAGDNFGVGIAAVGENVLIGAYTDDTDGINAGMAYLFSRDGNLLHTFHNPTVGSTGRFGRSVAAYGETGILVGNPEAYLFEGIPEPSTIIIWSLLGALALTVGWWRRRRAA